MNLKEKDLERVAHMEIAMVDKKFRGRGLQKKLIGSLQKIVWNFWDFVGLWGQLIRKMYIVYIIFRNWDTRSWQKH